MSTRDERPDRPARGTPGDDHGPSPEPPPEGTGAAAEGEDGLVTPPRPGSAGLSDEMERARVVAEVLADQASRQQARRSLSRSRGTTVGRVVAMVVLAAAAIYVWVAPPPWLNPAPLPEMTMEREEAGLRLAMYIQAQRIQAFRDDRGRLPDQLRETGEPLPGMVYERIDARTYRLRGGGNRVTLMYVSDDSLRVFARDAEAVLGVEL